MDRNLIEFKTILSSHSRLPAPPLQAVHKQFHPKTTPVMGQTKKQKKKYRSLRGCKIPPELDGESLLLYWFP